MRSRAWKKLQHSGGLADRFVQRVADRGGLRLQAPSVQRSRGLRRGCPSGLADHRDLRRHGPNLVEEQDEYIRILMVRQSLWASAFTLSVATIWGFLESFELAGHVDSYMIVVVWFFGQGVGAIVNKVTRGEAASCA